MFFIYHFLTKKSLKGSKEIKNCQNSILKPAIAKNIKYNLFLIIFSMLVKQIIIYKV